MMEHFMEVCTSVMSITLSSRLWMMLAVWNVRCSTRVPNVAACLAPICHIKIDCCASVEVDGILQPVGNFTAGDVSGSVHQYLPYYGQVAVVTTPALSYLIHAVQPQISQAGLARGHADVQVTLTKPLLDLHGLLGQSYGQFSRSCSQDFLFSGEGDDSDYLLPSLSEVDYKHGRFGRKTTRSRKAMEVDILTSQFHLVTAGITSV